MNRAKSNSLLALMFNIVLPKTTIVNEKIMQSIQIHNYKLKN